MDTLALVIHQLTELDGLQDQVRDFLAWRNIPAIIQQQLQIIIDELVSNAILHGSGVTDHFRLEVQLSIAQATCTLVIRDNGPAFNPLTYNTAPETALNPEEIQTGGWGILISRSLADEIRYDDAQSFNTLIIQKKLP